MHQNADPGVRAVLNLVSAAAPLVGMWFRIPPGHVCLSLVSAVYC
jgi:hypothetical protein